MEKTLFKGFHHVSINANNFDLSYKFYSEILNLQEKVSWIHKDKRAVMFDCGNNNYIEIFETEDVLTPGTQLAHFALRTSDCAAALKLVKDFGLEITVELEEAGIPKANMEFKIAFFKGPSGELVELFEVDDIS